MSIKNDSSEEESISNDLNSNIVKNNFIQFNISRTGLRIVVIVTVVVIVGLGGLFFQERIHEFSENNQDEAINNLSLTPKNTDPETFVYLFSGYSKDKNNVYHNDKVLAEADPDTFEKMGSGGYAKDKNYYYDGNGNMVGSLDSSKPRVFLDKYLLLQNNLLELDYGMVGIKTVINDPDTLEYLGAGYFKDSTNVYSFTNSDIPRGVLAGVNPTDFAIYIPPLDSKDPLYSEDTYYLKYDNTVTLVLRGYTTGELLIEGVDAVSFELLRFPYSKDKNNVYHYGDIVEGADPVTFSFFSDSGYVDYTFDQFNVYFGRSWPPERSKIVTGANPKTFRRVELMTTPFIIVVGTDDRFVYFNGQKLEGVSSGELKIESNGFVLEDFDTTYNLHFTCSTKGTDIKYLPESVAWDLESYKSTCPHLEFPSH